MNQAIITPQEMYAAEQTVFATGRASFSLMKQAGEGVAALVEARFPKGKVRVLCGPGGNGGDGFVAASHLAMLGRSVEVFLLGSTSALRGDPLTAFSQWPGPVGKLANAIGSDADITIDALFGGGLSRPLGGICAELAEGNRSPTVSVDVPSGLDGLSGEPLGMCFRADLSVTFAALRPAHVLSPGRDLCGLVEVIDIGVPVPRHTFLREISIGDLRSVQSIANQQELDTRLTGISPTPGNRIEAARVLAARDGHSVLIKHPDRILAEPSGSVTVSPP